jgi:chemotaxis protein methyltransferase CheR
MTGINSLILALSQSPITDPLWQKLIQTITIGETYFYRDNVQFTALLTRILPDLIEEKRRAGRKTLRFWSAGCASGEEPYTLAIVLRDLLTDLDTWSVSILGTDLNMASLERARCGLYRATSFRAETPDWLKHRWFAQTPDGYELDRKIRDMVVFAPLNLIRDSFPSYDSGTMNMDLILCRNVTIYFQQPDVVQVASKFYRSLNSVGWLVVGHSEPLAANYPQFTSRTVDNSVVYQKVETEPSITPPIITPLVVVKDTTPPASIPTRAPLPVAEEPVEEKPGENAPWFLARDAADRAAWSEALMWLEQAEDKNKLDPQFHYLRSLIQQQTDDYEGALWSLRQAIYCDPTFVLAHYSLGDLYARRREYKVAARHWRRAKEVLSRMNPEYRLPLADDLTVDILTGLLNHRLKNLPT